MPVIFLGLDKILFFKKTQKNKTNFPVLLFVIRFDFSRANISPGPHALFAQNLESGAGSPPAGEHPV